MKIAFKLTDSGLKVGKPYITLHSSDRITHFDPGFDFIIQDDPTIKLGNLLFTQTRLRQPKMMRCGINIPCSSIFDKSGNRYDPESGQGQEPNSNDTASGKTANMFNQYKTLANWSNEHIYIGKSNTLGRTCILKTSTGLAGVPEQVKQSGKDASHLVRLTIDGPTYSGRERVAPGTTGPLMGDGYGFSGDYIQLESTVYHMVTFHSFAFRTIFTTNRTDGPSYSSALILTADIGEQPQFLDTCIVVPNRDFTNLYGTETEVYTTNMKRVLTSARRGKMRGETTETEAGYGFEGRDRDICITNVIINSDGSLNLVAMDNQLNTNRFTAGRFVSMALNPDSSANPESPVPSVNGLDSLFVRI